MLTNKEVFEKFEKLHSYSFATIDNEYPEIRIAHLLTYDDKGLYFQTMKVKPFYKQLKKDEKVAILSHVTENINSKKDEEGLSYFPPGFFIRLKGDVRELSFQELVNKSLLNNKFIPLINDIKKYPTMTTFVIDKYCGEVFDYDFEKSKRNNKILRNKFSFNQINYVESFFKINSDKCISCGMCKKVCSFYAIEKNNNFYSINKNYCDECGSCYVVCPKNAIIVKNEMSEEDKIEAKNVLKKLYF